MQKPSASPKTPPRPELTRTLALGPPALKRLLEKSSALSQTDPVSTDSSSSPSGEEKEEAQVAFCMIPQLSDSVKDNESAAQAPAESTSITGSHSATPFASAPPRIASTHLSNQVGTMASESGEPIARSTTTSARLLLAILLVLLLLASFLVAGFLVNLFR